MLGFLKDLFKSGSGTQITIDIGTLSSLWVKDTGPQEDTVKPEQTLSDVQVRESEKPVLSVYDMLSDIIDPYVQVIQNQGLWSGIVKVMELVEKYGSYPSVVVGSMEEYDSEVLSILSKVSLKSHSVTVTRLFIEEIKNNFRDPMGLIAYALVAGLGHDIGKAEPLRQSPQYSKFDHPLISADVVTSCFDDPSPIMKAINSIKEHHKVTNDQLTGMLQYADQQARVKELKEAHRAVMAVQDAVSVGDIIQEIEKHINVPTSEWDINAFSFRGMVYVTPDFLYDSLKKVAQSRGILIDSQLRLLDKVLSLKTIVEYMRKAGAIPDIKLGSDYYQWYEIKTNSASRKKPLIPLRIESFGVMPSDLEQRKLTQSRSGVLKFITSVTPSGKVKSA